VKPAALLPVLALLLIAAGEPAKPGDPAPDEEIEHTVAPGETLYGIASRASVPRVLIIEANALKAPYTVRAGQTLKIPRTRRHTVIRGDTGFSVAYRYGVPWSDIAVANGIDQDKPLRPGQELLIPTIIAVPDAAPTPSGVPTPAVRFAWPLPGAVRRGFTARGGADYHDGLDITGVEGAAVRASAPGKVLFAGSEPRQFGNLVVIDHGSGWVSAYAFLSRVTVEKDEDVRAGERVGLVGHTGLAKGSELHFELRRNNHPVDPASQLSAAAVSPAPRTPPPSSDRPPAKSRSRSGAAPASGHAAPAKARPRE
jgi:murein DD-endopeptidase MepM/ murein hydrolase activator NlpD